MRAVALAAALLLAAACGGIPLMSMPKLVSLQGKILDINPAEFMVAVQADTRLTPPSGSAPVMNLEIKPREEGSFPHVRKMLRMQPVEWSAGMKGLSPAPASRRWFVYAFTAEAAVDLRTLQEDFRKIRASGKGGSVSIGISQQGIAARNPELGNTKWESWIQAAKADGFFELWSGPLGDLLAKAGPH